MTEADGQLFLEEFSPEEFEEAQAGLLDRFDVYHGVLVNRDDGSVITPDDVPLFRRQAEEIRKLGGKDALDRERALIISVLVYLLMEAESELGGVQQSSRPSASTLEALPQLDDYIVRLLLYDSRHLEWETVRRLIDLYATRDAATPPRGQGRYRKYLYSSDNVLFLLDVSREGVHVNRQEAPPPAAEKPEPAKVKAAPAAPVSIGKPVVLLGEGAGMLADKIHQTRTGLGFSLTAASYIGVGRKQNEDGVVLVPEIDEALVIDAMGGYGNGVRARDLFIQTFVKQRGDLPVTVEQTQKLYDEVDLGAGGVCLFGVRIEQDGNDLVARLAQMGDVHLLIFDAKRRLRHESIDEAIGHQVMNAVVAIGRTEKQRESGWNQFGRLTRRDYSVERGWRILAYSDGIANHYNASAMSTLQHLDAAEQIRTLSADLDKRMREKGNYRDNCSIAIFDL
ncbi:MAG: hypothetical protein P8Y78_09200 [Acidihalobacter sp.]